MDPILIEDLIRLLQDAISKDPEVARYTVLYHYDEMELETVEFDPEEGVVRLT